MILTKLKIENFRNYRQKEMIFEKGINYLYGSNGVGKTNLIEAIYYIGNLESFRSSDDRSLIKDFNGEFTVCGIVDGINYDLKVNREIKKLSIDGILYKKYRDYLGHVNVVEFIPEEVYLLKDFPKDRRKFIDKEISKIDRDYLNNILGFNKLLKQRNELLKRDDAYKDTLIDVIDTKISDLQAKIIASRKEFLNSIESIINKFSTSINKKYEFKIIYQSCFEKETREDILKRYKDSKEKDKEKKVTGLGIHKDDFKIKANDNDLSLYGSQGEQRFIVLLIKLALIELVKIKTNQCPILVLDDVFSELDDERQKEIIEIIKNIDQTFITGCYMKDIEKVEQVTKYEIKGENNNE